MKTLIKSSFLLPSLLTAFSWLSSGCLNAQTFTTLHSFDYYDGANSFAKLVLSGNVLYGTASAGVNSGGFNGDGTVFAINTDGTGFANLYNFTSDLPAYTNGDGAAPFAGVIISGGTLYGTAYEGGSAGAGTVFAVNTNGTGFTNLYEFSGGSDGSGPNAGVIMSGNTLYGTTTGGGSGSGVVYAINADGTGFTNIYSFAAGSDGAHPGGGLVLAGKTLYGTASAAGDSGDGTVFKVNTDGSGFAVLHTFSGASYPSYTNADGANPYSGLVISGSTLYGTTSIGGISGFGIVYGVNTNGTQFTNLHAFNGASDGAAPDTSLILSSNTLYGTAYNGGSGGSGTIFAVHTDGSGFTTLYNFTVNNLSPYTNSDGAHPDAALVLAGNTLYGTANGGGNASNITHSSSGYGTVFSLALGAATPSPPQLAINHSGTNVILTWPSNAVVFTLQSATNLLSPAWTTVSPAPVYVGGSNTVTNTLSGTQKFYRLSQ